MEGSWRVSVLRASYAVLRNVRLSPVASRAGFVAMRPSQSNKALGLEEPHA